MLKSIRDVLFTRKAVPRHPSKKSQPVANLAYIPPPAEHRWNSSPPTVVEAEPPLLTKHREPPPPAEHDYEPFQYKPLTLTEPSIRLLRVDSSFTSVEDVITCTIEETPIDESQYVALSYTWGSDVESFPIILNGQILHIQGNLWDFLCSWRSQRATSTGGVPLLWVDAICINQADQHEKSMQVQMMSEVYRKAVQVVVWLGGGTDTVRHVRRALTNPPFQHELVQSFYRNEYWTRVWIVQEISLARTVLLKDSGGEMLLSTTYGEEQSADRSSSRPLQSTQPESGITFDDLFDLGVQAAGHSLERMPFARVFKWISTYRRPPGDKKPLLVDFLERFETARCHDPRDRVFASLALIADAQSIEVDYLLNLQELYLKILKRMLPTISTDMFAADRLSDILFRALLQDGLAQDALVYSGGTQPCLIVSAEPAQNLLTIECTDCEDRFFMRYNPQVRDAVDAVRSNIRVLCLKKSGKQFVDGEDEKAYFQHIYFTNHYVQGWHVALAHSI